VKFGNYYINITIVFPPVTWISERLISYDTPSIQAIIALYDHRYEGFPFIRKWKHTNK
jgi:hypothetical protein